MPVNKNNILHDVIFFIKDDLDGAITDPISSTRSSNSKFIMTSYPERHVQYPIITIKCTNFEARRAGMQTTSQDITMVLELRVWARNEVEKDRISQAVLDRLASIQFTSTTGSVANNLHDLDIQSGVEVDSDGEPGGQSIKSRIIKLTYRFYNQA